MYTLRLLSFSAVLLFLVPLWSQADEPFYKGKQLVIIVSAYAGSSYDLYPRVAAKHLSMHIPGNPKIVIKNMPGASGLLAANWLYNVARKDGLTIGAIHRTLPLAQALGVPQARFDPVKFQWLGTPVQETASCFVRSDTPYKTIEDLVETSEPVKMAATQPRSDIYIVPLLLNDMLKTKMKVTPGYSGIGTAALAVEKGEVDGVCGWGYASLSAIKSDWFKRNFIRILLQIGREKHSGLPDIPLASDLIKSPKHARLLKVYDTQLSVGRPWVVPPGVPAERVKVLRKAFTDAVNDPQFLKDAAKAKIQVNPLSGEELQGLVEEMVDVSPEDRGPLKKVFNY